jgi:hypothetical protein
MLRRGKVTVEVIHGHGPEHAMAESGAGVTRTQFAGAGRHGRHLKWCLTYNGPLGHRKPNVQPYQVDPWIADADLIRRLEDERDAFQQTLREHVR